MVRTRATQGADTPPPVIEGGWRADIPVQSPPPTAIATTTAPARVADPPVVPQSASTAAPATPSLFHSPAFQTLFMQMMQMIGGAAAPTVSTPESSSQGAARTVLHTAHTAEAPVTEPPTERVQAPTPDDSAAATTATVLPASEVGKALDRFLRIATVRFSGAPTQDATEFITVVESRLRTLQILEAHGPDFVSYLLDKEAGYWYRSYMDRRPMGSPPPTWDQFREAFLDQYVPRSVRESFRSQFLQLQQGSMLVSEYEAQFTRLA